MASCSELSYFENQENAHSTEYTFYDQNPITNSNAKSKSVSYKIDTTFNINESYPKDLTGERTPIRWIYIELSNPSAQIPVNVTEINGKIEDVYVTQRPLSFYADYHTHTFDSTWKSDATYHWQTCSVCNAVVKTAHDWDAGAVTATPAGQDDEITYTCAACGKTKTEFIHTFATAWTSNDTHHWHAATCAHTDAKDGYAAHTLGATVSSDATHHWYTCSVCNADVKTTHTWDAGVVTTKPTVTTEGEKTYTCTICEETKTEPIPVLTPCAIHDWVWKGGSYECKVCGETKSALKPEEVEGYLANCKADGISPAKTIVETDNSGVATIGNAVKNSTVNVELELTGSVTSICDYAFGDGNQILHENLISVKIPQSVTSIGAYAFYGCSSLTSVEIPNNVTSIGRAAFCRCYKLESVTIPGSVELIGKSAFNLSGLTSVTIPSSVKSIGEDAFLNCTSLTSVTIENGVESIGRAAFQGCSSLGTKVTIPSSVTSIGKWAFLHCTSLTEVKFDDIANWYVNDSETPSYTGETISTATVDASKFRNGGVWRNKYLYKNPASGHTHTIAGEWTYDADYHWHKASCGIEEHNEDKTEHTWDDGEVTTEPTETTTGVKTYTCTACGRTKTETLPKVTVCDHNNWTWDEGTSMYKCKTCGSTKAVLKPEEVEKYLDNCWWSTTAKTIVDASTGTSAIKAAFEKSYTDVELELVGDITIIEDEAFKDCRHLVSVKMPNSVTQIGKNAFYGCRSLTSVTIPVGVTTIEKSVFEYCESLTSVTIPVGVTTIEESVFEYCKSLTSVTIPEGVTAIGDWVFNGCYALTSVTIPEGVTTIGQGAFGNCNFVSITIPESVTTIGDKAFYSCDSLASVTIPEGVTTIGYQVFYDCRSLTSVTIPEGVTTIGEEAFCDCKSLTSVTIPSSVMEIGKKAFNGCSNLETVTFVDTTSMWYTDSTSEVKYKTKINVTNPSINAQRLSENDYFYGWFNYYLHKKPATP